MFYQIFLPPKIRRGTDIGNKHGTYELPDQLPNDLRLKTKGQEKFKASKNYNLVQIHLFKVKILLILAKNFRKIETKTFS